MATDYKIVVIPETGTTTTMCVLRSIHTCYYYKFTHISQTVTGDDTDSVVPPDSAPLDQSGE